MTAPVRLCPPEVAKQAALLADQELFLSAVGQRDPVEGCFVRSRSSRPARIPNPGAKRLERLVWTDLSTRGVSVFPVSSCFMTVRIR